MSQPIIYACSDAVGETAEAVAKATLRQFPTESVQIKRCGQLRKEEEIIKIVSEAKQTGGFISYTLVQPELRELMKDEARRLGVIAVDVMGPMMQGFIDTFGGFPRKEPGLLHSMDAEYYRRIEAIEFTVKYDDGKDVRGLLQAQVILIGISRTSKTPLSVYLSHKGIKVANLPLIPEVAPPSELSLVKDALIVGLTMQPDKLLDIRAERLKALGLPASAQYASLERIQEELAYAEQIMNDMGCSKIDVTNRAVEETAGIIMGWLYQEK